MFVEDNGTPFGGRGENKRSLRGPGEVRQKRDQREINIMFPATGKNIVKAGTMIDRDKESGRISVTLGSESFKRPI